MLLKQLNRHECCKKVVKYNLVRRYRDLLPRDGVVPCPMIIDDMMSYLSDEQMRMINNRVENFFAETDILNKRMNKLGLRGKRLTQDSLENLEFMNVSKPWSIESIIHGRPLGLSELVDRGEDLEHGAELVCVFVFVVFFFNHCVIGRIIWRLILIGRLTLDKFGAVKF